jgi:hypothetical protein
MNSKTQAILWLLVIVGFILGTTLVCVDVPEPQANFELIKQSSFQLPTIPTTTGETTSTTETSIQATSSTTTTTSSTIITTTTDSTGTTSNTESTSSTGSTLDPPPVTNPTISFNILNESTKITWENPSYESYAGVLIRMNVYYSNDSDGHAPSAPTEGSLVADVGKMESPNNRTSQSTFLPCPPERELRYFYSLFTYNEWGYYSPPVSVSIIPKDILPPEPISNASVVYDSASDVIHTYWQNPPVDLERAIVRYSTSDYPLTSTSGSSLTNSPYLSGEESDSLTSPSKGQVYYFSFFAEDCFGNISDPVFAEVDTPPTPPSNLMLYPGVERIFIFWVAASGASEYVLRYNTTGDAITSITDGDPVRTVENPLCPGVFPVIPEDQNIVEHRTDSAGNPLATDITYYYAIFTISASGVASDPLTGSIELSATVEELFYDGFEGTHDFCSTWDARDLYKPASDSYVFWGPYNNPNSAFEGSYYAFSGTFISGTNDCATANGWNNGHKYQEYQHAMLSYNISENLTTYSRVYVVWRANYYTDQSTSGCWMDSGNNWLAVPEMWVDTTGSYPERDDTELDIQYTLLDQTWTGWHTKITELTNYRTDGQTAFGFNWWTRGDNSCSDGGDTTTGGWMLDTIHVIAIP